MIRTCSTTHCISSMSTPAEVPSCRWSLCLWRCLRLGAGSSAAHLPYNKITLIYYRLGTLLFHQFYFSLQLSHFLVEFLYHSLGEVGPFGQLIFHFFVYVEFLRQFLKFGLHFLILEDEFFCLFGLILELAGELMVLENGQPSGGGELFFLQGEKVGPHIPDFV